METFLVFTFLSLSYCQGKKWYKSSLPHKKDIKLPRKDSEFTLGFEKSKSVGKILNELGPLCSTGQHVVSITKFICVATLISAVTIYISKNSKWNIKLNKIK
jgi:hypothetical protein